jgi:ABC-2 type transport system ATP-binding protein
MEKPIEVDNLTVRFRHRGQTVTALDGVTLSVGAGEVVGFLGPNGAGKTTTMHVLLGFVAAAQGEARLFGADVRRSIARQRIGYLPEHPDTYRFLNGYELLTMAGQLFGLKGRALRQRIDDLLEQVDLKDAARRRIATYSRGMMQRIGLAQALINDPDLVILDEPTGGMDPIGRMQIRALIDDLRKRGKTVFFSSHELSEVELVCDHLVMLVGGRVVARGPADSLVEPGERLESYFLRVVEKNRSAKGGTA